MTIVCLATFRELGKNGIQSPLRQEKKVIQAVANAFGIIFNFIL